jgi:hypothetical protein
MHCVLLVHRMMTQQDPDIDAACIDAELAELHAEVRVHCFCWLLTRAARISYVRV